MATSAPSPSPSPSTKLKDEASNLTNYGFLTIPLHDGIPTVEYKLRRTKLASEQERNEWYSNGKTNGIAIAINNTEFAIDTDGQCENLLLEDVLPQLPDELQNKIQSTMYTRTPHGYHRTFRIKPEDFPQGVKEKVYVRLKDHNEIVVVGREHILRERGPDHMIINGVENIVTLSKTEVNELFMALEVLEKEIKVIVKIAELLKPYYYQPHRDEIIFSVSGYLHKGKTPEHITKRIALYLASLTSYSDENIDKIISTIKDTYAKDPNSDQVSGYNRLKEALTSASKPGSQVDDASNVIVEMEYTLKAAGVFKIPQGEHQHYKQTHQGNSSNYNDNDNESDKQKVKTYEVYKYSKDIPLAEEIVLGQHSVFLQIIDGEPITKPVLDFGEERNVIFKSHEITNQLTPIVIPYTFKDLDEIRFFIELAKQKSIYDLFLMSESLWKQLLVAKDQHVITFYTTDTIYSYFQDLFPTTHYDMIIGIPGAGKGAVLVSFRIQGYRPVMASGMSGANLLELLGSVEACQVTVMEDELQNMENDPHKEAIYKVGYDETNQVPKTLDGNKSSRHNQWFLPYSFKIFAAEKPPDSKTLGGFNDRTFRIESLKGKPKFLPKTILYQLKKPEDKRNPKYKKIISKMFFLRKLLLIYRLLHHDDIIEEVETNIDGRALELTSPQIYLFNSDKLYSKDKEQDVKSRQLVLYDKILPALSKFLKGKGELTKKTLEGVIYDALTKELFSEIDNKENIVDLNGDPKTKYIIPYEDICDKVKQLTDGEDDPYHAKSFVSPDFGTITHNQILDICKNRFSGYKTKDGTGNNRKRVVEFTKEEVLKMGSTFEAVTDIEVIETKQEEESEDDDDEEDDMTSGSGGGSMWSEWKQKDKKKGQGQAHEKDEDQGQE